MMRVENKPLTSDPTLLANLQSEVAQESRPLLQLITNNAKYIVALIVLCILAMIGTGIYGYITSNRVDEIRNQVATLMAQPADAKQLESLQALVKECPQDAQTTIYMAIVQSALQQGNVAAACDAYAAVAQIAAEDGLGLAAKVNQAGLLMNQGKYAEAVKILLTIKEKLDDKNGVRVKVMLAEGAARSDQKELAATTYQELSALSTGLDKEYFASRAQELGFVPAKTEQAESK